MRYLETDAMSDPIREPLETVRNGMTALYLISWQTPSHLVLCCPEFSCLKYRRGLLSCDGFRSLENRLLFYSELSLVFGNNLFRMVVAKFCFRCSGSKAIQNTPLCRTKLQALEPLGYWTSL